MSRRLRAVLGFMCVCTALRAALYQVFGDFAEAGGAVGIGSEFGDGLGGEFVGDLVGAFEAMDGGVGGFLLGGVFAGGFAEGGGGFFDVEDVVGDLEEEA